MTDYSKRRWLNDEASSSTGSVVAFHGDSPWGNKRKRDKITLLEISDCHSKIRLHKTDADTMGDFVSKLEKLHDEIGEFIAHLKIA